MPSSTAPPGVLRAAANDRLASLDLLRGLALLAMMVVHFHQRLRLEVGGLADLPGWFVYVFLEQKSWGTFAILFGVGFAVLLRRLEARHARVVPIYLRRLGALALCGAVAEVAFGFHILLSYAGWGLVLLAVRRWPTPRLIAGMILAVTARPIVAEVAALSGHPLWFGGDRAIVAPLRAAVEAAARQPDYGVLLHARWALFLHSWPHGWYTLLLPDINLALFLVGMIALRIGIFDAPLRHRRIIYGAMTFGVLSWAVSWLVLPHLPLPTEIAAQIPILYGFGVFQDQWLCLTYIGAVVLAIARRPVWIHRLDTVASAGRMALTNYMAQCALVDILASVYGLALRVTPLTGLIASTVSFAALALGSHWWLCRFRYGPLEWLWRAATYWQRPPMRRVSAPVAQTT